MNHITSPHHHPEEKKVGQLDGWTPPAIARHIDLDHFISEAMATNLPPWRPIPSRSVALTFGCALQTLANWRMRNLGPRPEPMRKGYGNRIYYRPDRIAQWLSGDRCADWQFSGHWLMRRGLMAADAMSRETVHNLIEVMDGLDIFPPAHSLWRRFRETESTSRPR